MDGSSSTTNTIGSRFRILMPMVIEPAPGRRR
jgi:hypothetical protein